jgi:hypothetical protein
MNDGIENAASNNNFVLVAAKINLINAATHEYIGKQSSGNDFVERLLGYSSALENAIRNHVG